MSHPRGDCYRLRNSVAGVLAVYVLARLIVVAVAATQPGPLTLETFAIWDAAYYLDIATNGTRPRSRHPKLAV